MICVDIETSGTGYNRAGILEIGAVDLENPKNIFREKARLSDEDGIFNKTNLVDPRKVTEILGMTEEEMRDPKKQSEKEMLEHFAEWIKTVRIKNFVCQNPQFDYSFFWAKFEKYGLEVPFYHRCMDIDTMALMKYFEVHGKFLTNKDYTDMGLRHILEFVGMSEYPKRKTHNALEDAKLEAECFSRLMYGKNLFEEFNKFQIPDYLKK
ncbi:MAG: 3'-5' exonuclease [archaeon]|nr:MAG: 3'-5' exonuclease [archaeon]